MLTANSLKDGGTTDGTEVTSTHHRCQAVFGTCCCVGWHWAVCSTVTWRTCHTVGILGGRFLCVLVWTALLSGCCMFFLHGFAMFHLNRLWWLKWPHSGADVYWKDGVWEGEPNSFLDRQKKKFYDQRRRLFPCTDPQHESAWTPSDEFDCNMFVTYEPLLIKFGTIFNPGGWDNLQFLLFPISRTQIHVLVKTPASRVSWYSWSSPGFRL